MKNFTTRLTGLTGVGYYIAPKHAQITPVPIPKNLEIIELITGGEVIFKQNGKDKTFGKGTIFWHRHKDQTVYRTTTAHPYRCAVFQFTVKDNNRPAQRVNFWNSGKESDIDNFISEAQNLFHSHGFDKDVLAIYLYSTLLLRAQPQKTISNLKQYPTALQKAITYINNNLRKKISIADLAQNSRVSQPHLFKLFQAHMKTTPHQYIRSQQLTKARRMLVETDKAIKEIAFECGFENIEVFYRRFRHASNMSPGQYQRQYTPYQLAQTHDAEI